MEALACLRRDEPVEDTVMTLQIGRYRSVLGTIIVAAEDDAVTGLWFEGQRHVPAYAARRDTESSDGGGGRDSADGQDGEGGHDGPGSRVEPGARCGTDHPADSVLTRLFSWLDAYVAGRNPAIDFPLAPRGTPFQQRVWHLLRQIPYGETVTYGDIAARVSASSASGRTSARAVGGAVGRNPISLVIPCHRVVGATGNLTGYAGGIDRKRALLKLEGIV
jgi:methylated-DNA-[protein]-cysteine S-methyltransferase